MGELNLLSTDALDEITRKLDIFALCNLYMTGDIRLISCFINGGVTRIRQMSFAHNLTTLRKSGISRHPTIWLDFRLVQHIEFSIGSPHLSFVPDHLLPNLKSLIVNSEMKDHSWNAIMEAAKSMKCLDNLSYNVKFLRDVNNLGNDAEYPSNPPSVISFPYCIKQTLTRLVIGVASVFDTSDLPPYLTHFDCVGRIKFVSCGASGRNTMTFQEHADEHGLECCIDHGRGNLVTITPFPETLTNFCFWFGIPHIEHRSFRIEEVFSMLRLCAVLPIALNKLNICGQLCHQVSCDDFIHLLPRHLVGLSLHLPSMKDYVSFSALPRSLKYLKCSVPLKPIEDFIVALPPSLEFVRFMRSLDISTWLSRIEFTNPNLKFDNIILPQNVDPSYFNHKTFSTNMVRTFNMAFRLVGDYHKREDIVLYGKGLHSLELGDDHMTTVEFAEVLRTCTSLRQLTIESAIASESEIDYSQTMPMFPSTLTDLILSRHCPSLYDLDMAKIIPQLRHFYISGDSAKCFKPYSLPPLIKLDIRRYEVDLVWLLSVLSNNISICRIHGIVILESSISDFDESMPLELGSDHLDGWNLELWNIEHRPSEGYSKYRDTNTLCNSMLRNRHLMTLDIKMIIDNGLSATVTPIRQREAFFKKRRPKLSE